MLESYIWSLMFYNGKRGNEITDREFDLLDLSGCHSHSIIRKVTHRTHKVQVSAGLLLKGPVVLHL